MTPLTRSSLETAAFWNENVCPSCGTIQTDEQPAGAPCQECDRPGTMPATVALHLLELVEENDADA